MTQLIDQSSPEYFQQTSGTFSIVDQYKGCDVVRYEVHTLATYKYFLHCTDSIKNK